MFPAQFKYDFAKLSHTWAFPAHFKTTALRKAYKHREAFSPAATGAETTMDVQRVRCQLHMMFPSSCQCLRFQARQPPRCSASDAPGSSQHLLCGAPLTPGSHWHGLAAGELRDCSGCCKLCSAARKGQRLRGSEEKALRMHHSTGAGPCGSPLSGVALPWVRLNVVWLWGCGECALGVSPGE